MSGRGAMEGGAEHQSQRDSDIRWFLARAQHAAEGIENPWGRAAAYSNIAMASVAAGNKTGFWEAVELAQGAAAAVEPAWAGASVSYLLHEFIAEGQVRAGNVASAMNTAAGIEDPVCKARAYCTIAHALAMAGNQAAGREAIELAQQAAAAVAGGASDAAYMSIAYTQASVGDVAAALSTAGRMVHLRFAAFCQIAYAHAEAGNTGASMEAIELAKQAAAVFEDPPIKAWASCMIARAQARARGCASPLRTGAGTEDGLEKAQPYAEMAGAQARPRDLAEAMRAAATIKEAAQKVLAYCSMAQAQGKVGDATGAKEALETARQAAGRIEGATNRALQYEHIAQVQAGVGEVRDLKAWVEALKEPEEVVRACLGAVKGLLGEDEERETCGVPLR